MATKTKTASITLALPSLNTRKERLTAYVSVRSLGGTSMFDETARLAADNVEEFFSDSKVIKAACRRLQDMGFEIERVSRLNIRISGPAALFEKNMGLKFVKRAGAVSGALRGISGAPSFKMLSRQVSFVPTLATVSNLMEPIVQDVEGFVFPQPVKLYAAPNANPPDVSYHHLNAPDDIARLMNASPVHAAGNRGQNVQAAMIDSGFQWSHPFFGSRNYDTKVALPEDDDTDADGHGTAQCVNFLAVAPQARLYGLGLSDIVESIQVARDDLKVRILSNSWGTGVDTDGPKGTWDKYWALVQGEIALCAKEGMVALFAAGNGDMSFTASMPETISVGGVYSDASGKLRASDYASSWRSTRFSGRKVPDVCGLTGMRPRGVYLMLPVPPASRVDRDFGGAGFPNADETTKIDGWAGFSGTSAACPMVAGVAALILSQYPGADLAEVRERLSRCVDVTDGQSAMQDKAGPGRDDATGFGLVDAQAAVR